MRKDVILTFRCCSLALVFSSSLVASAFAAESPGLDALLGGSGRAQLQAELKTLVFDNGKAYSWQDYSAWGKEIFLSGRVKTPPTGSSPSKPVSKYFTCARCHNYEREDPILPVLDPEARFEWIERTGEKIFMLQGVTLWGGVNRKTFYAGDFSKYHDLCVPKGEELFPWLPCGPIFGWCIPGCRTMHPDSLVDATQVCSHYCSVGRYLKAWELYALMAFFWDQEIRLDDLDLQPQTRADALAVFDRTRSGSPGCQAAAGSDGRHLLGHGGQHLLRPAEAGGRSDTGEAGCRVSGRLEVHR